MKKEKMSFRLECRDIETIFCETMGEIKKNWGKITKHIQRNRNFYEGNELEMYNIFRHTKYILEFEGKMTFNLFREEYYELHFYQLDRREDVRFDFKPDKIDKTMNRINKLLRSDNPLESCMGKIGVDAFYMFLFTLDKVVNPLFVFITDDNDGWEDSWEHYLTVQRFNTIDFRNLKYIPYHYRQLYSGHNYGENFGAREVYKIYLDKKIKQLYVKIEEDIDDNGIDTFWTGKIIDISKERKSDYLLLSNVNKVDCRCSCGTSNWVSRYDDPMDI